MNKYLIALDMDGTLLTDDKKLTSKTKRILRKLQKQGHYIVLASGRPPHALEKYYNEIGLTSPLICFNGCYVYNPKDSNFKITKFEFPQEVIKSINRNLGPKHIMNMICEDLGHIYVNSITQGNKDYLWIGDDIIHEGPTETTLNVNPMTVIFEAPGPVDEEAVMNEIHKYEGLDARFWKNTNFTEIFYDWNNKKHAIENLAKQLGLDYDHTIVFGDEQNDIFMFEAAKYSVCMSNARPEIKEKAKLTSLKDNNHNGVVITLKKLLKDLKKNKA